MDPGSDAFELADPSGPSRGPEPRGVDPADEWQGDPIEANPGASGSGGPSTGHAAWDWVRRRAVAVRAGLRDPGRRVRIGVAIGVATSYIALIASYAQGRLIYGQDFPGVYSPYDFLLRTDPDFLIPSAAVLLSGGNIYLGYYLAAFAECFATAYACQIFARELFSPNFSEQRLQWLQALAAVLFVFSPTAVVTTNVSLLELVFLSSAAFFLVMALLVRLLRRLRDGRTFSIRDAVLLGAAVGLAAPDSFPNQVRVLGFIGLALAGILVGALVAFRRPAQRSALRVGLRNLSLVSLPLAGLLLTAVLFNLATTWGSNLAGIRAVAADFHALFSGTTYNTFPMVIRLLGKHSFPGLPYGAVYLSNPPVVIASYLWPEFAVLIPLLFAALYPLRERAMLLLVEGLVIVGLLWETGTNPPFGAATGAFQSALPFGPVLVPTYFVTLLFLSKAYPVLIAFSVVALAGLVPSRRTADPTASRDSAAPPTRRRRWSLPSNFDRWSAPQLLFVLGATGVLLLAAAPELDGSAVGTHVFRVPADYFNVRSILWSLDGNAVLLPSVAVYVSTTWGFYGANGFYNEFFYPSQVVSPAFWGPYEFYLNSTKQEYAAATEPILPVGNGTPLLSAPGSIQQLVAGAPAAVYSLARPLHLGRFDWVALRFDQVNVTLVESLIASGSLVIGVGSGGARGNLTQVGWYVVGASTNSWIHPWSPGGCTIYLQVPQPSTPSKYAPGNVSSFLVEDRAGSASTALDLGHLAIGGVNATLVSPSWLPLMAQLGVRYVLVDHTLKIGAHESDWFITSVIHTLEQVRLLSVVYDSPNVTLYRIH